MTKAWEAALDELASVRMGRLLAFATMLAGPDDADDLVQEAVIATFSRQRRFDSVGHAERYVRRAIATRYVDRVRKDSASRARERAAAVPEAVGDATMRVEARDAVDQALATLPPRARACVVLRYLEDLSVRETAHTLGLSEGAVKRYCSDGLASMAAVLGTDLADGPSEISDVARHAGGAR